MRQRTILTAAAAPAAAILVFGVIYGSVARPLMGAGSAMLSSLFVFSGAVQFTIAALLSAGAGAGALVPGSVTLNLRNVVLGAVVRPRIDRGPVRRAGLALASGADAARTLLTAGTTFYLTWQAGTVRGLLGASVDGVRTAAVAVFPVLFIGLAALACSSRSMAVRAVTAAGVTGVAAYMWPGGRGVTAVVAAIAVAIPGRDR